MAENSDPAPVSGRIVTKCRAILAHSGRAGHCDVDLLLTPGQPPQLVLEWRDYPEAAASIPGVAIQLDPRYLHPLRGWGQVTHMYEMQIDSPIPIAPPD